MDVGINVTEGWTLWLRILCSALSYFLSSFQASAVRIQKTTFWILDVYFLRLQMFMIVELLKYSTCQFTIEFLLEELYGKVAGG